jgi:dTDP-4-amino-4,6-dideoxygalactose transaminase
MKMISNLQNWPCYSKEEINAVTNVLNSNKVNYWTGEQSKLFEKEFAKWSGSKFSIALSNGTVALELALRGLDIKAGDEVIVTPRSFIASASAVVSVGARPVFSDVDLLSGNLNSINIEKVLTKKTKAIICVHLGGLPCEMDEIMKLARKNSIYVIEDCAQAHGASYKGKGVGSIGDVGAWSFCQDKIMTTGGEGGMVTTNNKSLWKKMWSYKDHGKNYDAVFKVSNKPGFKWLHDSFGTNWRMTEMQSAIGRIQLDKMDKWNQLRNRNANRIIETFKNFPDLIQLSPISGYINHAYYRVYASINTNALNKLWTRDKIVKKINELGVPCFTGSCPEIYKEKAFLNSSFMPKYELKNSKKLGENSIAFLCHPTLTIKNLDFMKKTITKVLEESSI